MCAASAWQAPQVVATFIGFTLERESAAGSMPCTPWQSVQTATLSSPFASCLPCTLVRYCEYWSVRSDGLYFRMTAASPWQLAHSLGISLRFGLPRKPAALLIALSGEVGSPPWHASQPRPLAPWISCICCSPVTCSGPSKTEWQSMQVLAVDVGAAFFSGVCAEATPQASSSAMSMSPRVIDLHQPALFRVVRI